MASIAGLDGGSVSVKIVVLDGRDVVHSRYRRHKGHPARTALELLREAVDHFPDLRLACTGSTGKALARALDAPFVSELSALALAVSRSMPEVRTIMEMGGEDSKLILLDDSGTMADFALNSVCAAGTGSFLDQQAERMRLSIEAFADLAVQSRHPAHVAGRCSVFAKSDMIHLQQIATPLEDIVAGLCFAVARNFKGSIIRGRTVSPQIAFLGGVALNQGVARAFREVFAEADGRPADIVVPDPPTQMAARGAALRAMEGHVRPRRPDLDALAKATRQAMARPPRPPLMTEGDGFADRHLEPEPGRVHRPQRRADGQRVPAWMGIDVGSISTNLALVDRDGRVLAKRYLMTASRPIEAVRQGLGEIAAEVSGLVDVQGVGTTGSGRYMIAAFVCADIVKNEITAQAAGAVALDANVDTIFEIGGQDSKFISLDGGVIADFEMNKACAAGTGSFLEEQAEKLGIPIKDEFARLALGAAAPRRLGERCTVFMENSLMAELATGAGQDDLLAGLSYSIVENYLNRVVGSRRVGSNIFFQGGTAFNKAVVAAFEKHLDQTVTVPEHHDVTGAIGMALIARDHALATGAPTTFRGFDLADAEYELDSFTCRHCENHCEINRVRLEGEKTPLLFGGRCERYDQDRSRAGEMGEDLFAWRETALRAEHERRTGAFKAMGRPAPLGRLGLPYVFFMHDLLPWFTTLCWELGFEPEVSPPTDRVTVRLGVEKVLAETCFPVKAALGHVRRLLETGVDRLLLPSFIDVSPADTPFESGLACPLTQSFPYQVRAAFPEAVVVAPPLDRRDGPAAMQGSLLRALAPLGVGRSAMRSAMRAADAAQAEFEANLAAKGREALDALEAGPVRALAVLGRPYNAFDKALNLGIPAKLAGLGVRAVPMDMLPDRDEAQGVRHDWPDLYWRSGQRILTALRAAKADPRLHPLIIGSFSCGPDSFIAKYVEHELDGAPCLSLEIDEHSADAGAVTRLEAFLDSIEAQEQAGRHLGWTAPPPPGPSRPPLHFSGRRKRTVYLPRMADHAFALEAAFRACGAEAEVLPETDVEAVAAARRYISGKECYPFAVTTADVLKKASEPGFDPSRAAFFMAGGSGPCRFGQYNVAQRMVLDRAGFPDLAIHSPMQDVELYEDLGIVGRDFTRRSWQGIVAIDLLTKTLHATRPMAKDPAQADAVYGESLARVRRALASNGSRDGDELRATLDRARRDFSDVERHGEPRPLIGIVGEIFVRSNRFSNEDLVRRVEALGGRAWLAPIDEWIYYVNAMAKRTTRLRRQWKRHLALRLKDHFQRRMAHGLESVFNGCPDTIHDPDTETILDKAAPWVHASFRGEAVLSMGKAVDMIERGAEGIVAAMPFGCMPGTVATALMRDLSARFGIPCISLPFDGTDSPANRLQLEAFMEQAVGRAMGRAAGRASGQSPGRT